MQAKLSVYAHLHYKLLVNILFGYVWLKVW